MSKTIAQEDKTELIKYLKSVGAQIVYGISYDFPISVVYDRDNKIDRVVIDCIRFMDISKEEWDSVNV